MKKIFSLLNSLVLVLIIFLGVSVILSKFNSPLGIRIFSVTSGSMEPKIKTGSIVFIKSQNEYKEDDVVTFYGSKQIQTITHRIIETKTDSDTGNVSYITKGDKNEDRDFDEVKQTNVLGKVKFTIPYLGYLVSFSQTQIGFVFLIIVPATILIYSEILNIKNEIKKFFFKNKDDKEI